LKKRNWFGYTQGGKPPRYQKYWESQVESRFN